ncbi:MAG: sulfatase-like hydrolase/transferase, partial [Planctomycetota bacterium]
MQPNICLIMTDQQRADSLGCYGGRAVATPHIDRLGAEGVVFDRAYCTNPICTPSRASLMTGHHLPRHGVYRLQDAMQPQQVMFPERLRGWGYQTGLIGKLHAQAGAIEAVERHPHDGFDRYELYYGGGAMMDSRYNGYAEWVRRRRPEVFNRLVAREKHAGPIPIEAHMNTWAAERSEDFLRTRDPDKPFFLMVSVFDPHNPYDDHPPEAEARVDRSRLKPLIPAATDLPLPPAVRREMTDNYFADFASLSADQIESMRVGYHAEVGLIDDLVGQIGHALESQGVLDDTLIVFLSDHGDMLG